MLLSIIEPVQDLSQTEVEAAWKKAVAWRTEREREREAQKR